MFDMCRFAEAIRAAIRTRNPKVARAAMESHIAGTVVAFSATIDDTVQPAD